MKILWVSYFYSGPERNSPIATPKRRNHNRRKKSNRSLTGAEADIRYEIDINICTLMYNVVGPRRLHIEAVN